VKERSGSFSMNEWVDLLPLFASGFISTVEFNSFALFDPPGGKE
jgi:hypothetical protein